LGASAIGKNSNEQSVKATAATPSGLVDWKTPPKETSRTEASAVNASEARKPAASPFGIVQRYTDRDGRRVVSFDQRRRSWPASD